MHQCQHSMGHGSSGTRRWCSDDLKALRGRAPYSVQRHPHTSCGSGRTKHRHTCGCGDSVKGRTKGRKERTRRATKASSTATRAAGGRSNGRRKRCCGSHFRGSSRLADCPNGSMPLPARSLGKRSPSHGEYMASRERERAVACVERNSGSCLRRGCCLSNEPCRLDNERWMGSQPSPLQQRE